MGWEYEEWRFVTRLLARTELIEELLGDVREATPDETDVHSRNEEEILLYAYTEKEARRGQSKLERALERARIPFESTLSRWNPEEERWQDPELAVGPSRSPIAPGWADLGELGWEVRARTPTSVDAHRMMDVLERQDRPAFTDGWRRVTVGVKDELEAARLVDELCISSPLTHFQTRPMTRFRRWQIRQALLGNYGDTSPIA